MRTLLLALFVLTGCGIPGSTPLVDLVEDERAEVCEDAITEMSTQTVECDVDDGTLEVTSEPGSIDDCVARFDLLVDGCEATLDEWTACNEAFEADPCLQLSDSLPAPCEAIFACYDLD